MATVTQIIEQLGGPKAIAEATGIPFTTVHTWKRKEFVPAWRVPTLVALAKRKKEPLTAADFPSERPRKVDLAA